MRTGILINLDRIMEQENGNIWVKDDFVTDEECKYIIDLSETVFQPSKLMGEENYVGYGRNSRSAFLQFREDKVLNDIRTRASKLINLPESHFEFFQCVSYDIGQEFQHHFDSFPEHTPAGKKQIEEWGQRKYTLLVYLNDDFEGGETNFLYLGMNIKPKRRSVLVFKNIDDDNKVIRDSFHAGLPVTNGRKYAMNIWARNNP